MATPQTILTRKTKSAIFLTLTINEGGEAAARDALTEIQSRINSVRSRDPEAALTGIVGIGSDAWDRLFSGPRPRALRPFTALDGPTHSAPSTPGDLLLHIKSDKMDLCYELGRLFLATFGSAVRVVEEIHGFRYFDLRDLIGFVDGSENPIGQAAIDTITVGDDPYFNGGSYITIQRYVTDFDDWDALTVEDQEAAIGRTKLDNVEMADDVKPPNSHIALNVVEDANGNQLDIVRDNMPYGDVGGNDDRGTFFIAYSGSPDVTDQMLRNMFLGDPPGNHDRLLDFTTAVTGVAFYAPTCDFLADPPPLPGHSVAATESADVLGEAPEDSAPGSDGDGSLGIGPLHGEKPPL